MERELLGRRCEPCADGTPPVTGTRLALLRQQVPAWEIRDGRLGRTFELADFRAAMAFLERVADVAEAEGHHPDFCVHYRVIDFSLWTHSIGGLSENDFILAAKIDALLGQAAPAG